MQTEKVMQPKEALNSDKPQDTEQQSKLQFDGEHKLDPNYHQGISNKNQERVNSKNNETTAETEQDQNSDFINEDGLDKKTAHNKKREIKAIRKDKELSCVSDEDKYSELSNNKLVLLFEKQLGFNNENPFDSKKLDDKSYSEFMNSNIEMVQLSLNEENLESIDDIKDVGILLDNFNKKMQETINSNIVTKSQISK